jgi:Domain of unknown function (DUF4331)
MIAIFRLIAHALARQTLSLAFLGMVLSFAVMDQCAASNHLDTSVVTANPQANIGDIYAWTAPDGRRLNLVMDIVGRSFSDKLSYVFYIDSGPSFGKTTATTTIACRFPDVNVTDCQLGKIDRTRGDAGVLAGLEGRNHRFRVFAGLRDDPFFNNVKGTRAAEQVAFAALRTGAPVDGATCPMFDQAIARSVLYQWRHTDGGPATNFLAHWTTSALVVTVDIDAVDRGGKVLAVWAATESSARRWDRLGRPLSKNALVGLTDPNGVGDKLEDQWNRLTPGTSGRFIADMEKSLAFYDGLDGHCGNQILVDKRIESVRRYRRLAALLTDDRLWVNAASHVCTQFFAVELANLAGRKDLRGDCGGRTPSYDASNAWRSLLVQGTRAGIDDGLHHDEHEPSSTKFPFLAPPDAQAIYH